MPAELPPNIVTPDPELEDTEQEPTKRFPWSKPAVATSPTLKVRRELKRAQKRITG